METNEQRQAKRDAIAAAHAKIVEEFSFIGPIRPTELSAGYDNTPESYYGNNRKGSD